jgi:hypothetical protein
MGALSKYLRLSLQLSNKLSSLRESLSLRELDYLPILVLRSCYKSIEDVLVPAYVILGIEQRVLITT